MVYDLYSRERKRERDGWTMLHLHQISYGNDTSLNKNESKLPKEFGDWEIIFLSKTILNQIIEEALLM